MDRFNAEQVIKILGIEMCADMADGGEDFNVACRIAINMIEEAQHYKDLAEQGRLVELICKIGTLIYYLNGEFLLDGICDGFSVDEDGAWLMHIQFNKSGLTHSCECSLLGKRFFFTKSEAEQAIAERQG